MLTDLRSAALKYGAGGLFIFPLMPCGKAPLIPEERGGHGFHDATTDLAQIDAWWTATPEANIGLHPGPSGFVVFDVDGPEGQAAAQRLGLLSEPTLAVITGRPGGGVHLYYRHPGGTIDNVELTLRADGTVSRRVRADEHIDLLVRGDAGYTVVPPSIHPSGLRYRWDKADLLPLPPDALELLRNGAGPRKTTVLPEGAPIPRGARNTTLTSLAGTMRRRGLEADEIAAALLVVNAKRCRPPLGDAEVERIATNVAKYPPADDVGQLRLETRDGDIPPPEPEEPAIAGPTPALAERPIIRVRDELVPVTDEALTALTAWPTRELYVRGRTLVQVARSEAAPRHNWLRRPPEAPVIVLLEIEALQDRLDRAAQWEQLKRKKWVPARPPEWVARQILKGRLTWPFPELVGITETPTLRCDGSVLDQPGYDDATGLLYLPSTAYPPVPELTQVTARQAADVLLDPVCDFPFTNDAAKSAYLAAVLSLLARDVIDGPVPGFPIRAPVPSSGKSLLAAVIALIGTGREPAVFMYPGDDAELHKCITVFAMEGTPLVLLDNCAGTIASNELAGALTARDWKGRVLGVSRFVEAPLRTLWLLTGNNIRFARTLGRRMVPIDLDPNCEHPEDRTGFKYADLLGYVRARRPQLVTAGLGILRAYLRAHRPGPAAWVPMGSFEAWEHLVRGALVWLGLADPAATDDPSAARGKIRAEGDDDLERIDLLLSAFAETFGTQTFIAADILAKVETTPDFKAVLQESASDRKGAFTPKSLGNTLKAVQDRWVRGHRLVRVPKQLGLQHGGWQVLTRPAT